MSRCRSGAEMQWCRYRGAEVQSCRVAGAWVHVQRFRDAGCRVQGAGMVQRWCRVGAEVMKK